MKALAINATAIGKTSRDGFRDFRLASFVSETGAGIAPLTGNVLDSSDFGSVNVQTTSLKVNVGYVNQDPDGGARNQLDISSPGSSFTKKMASQELTVSRKSLGFPTGCVGGRK